jgi:hypothetical protein
VVVAAIIKKARNRSIAGDLKNNSKRGSGRERLYPLLVPSNHITPPGAAKTAMGSQTLIPAVCADLKAKGAVLTRGPVTIRPGTRIAFLSGPEGASIELLERTPVS